MRVYNLTRSVIDYRGKILQPNGGSEEYPELNGFIPNRDLKLQEEKVLAFGVLPMWWQKESEPVPKEPPLALRVIEAEAESAPLTMEKRKKAR